METFSEDNRKGLKNVLKGNKVEPVITTAVGTTEFRWRCSNVQLKDSTNVVVKILQQRFEIYDKGGIKQRDEWRDVPEIMENNG